MIDFPLGELLDEVRCTEWLAAHLHPNGLSCPNCQSERRRNFRQLRHWQAYRCLACERYDTLLSETVFEKSQQAPSTLVMLLRGIAKGESSSQLARELPMSRKQVGVVRQKIQENLYDHLPTEPMIGSTFEADEIYQNAGEKK
jgi:transposase-like protein